MDARVAKNIKLGEHRNLQLAFQAFNLFNHANYGNDFFNTVGSNFNQPSDFINPTSTTLPGRSRASLERGSASKQHFKY